MKENVNLREYALSEIENLKVHGRTTDKLNPLTLFWTGSFLELNAKGSELWVEVDVDYEDYEPWISILINEVPVSRQMLTCGRYWIPVFRGMTADVVKNVRIVRDVQAMSGDPSSRFQIHGVKFDGEFLAIENKPYAIEFIGDSITSGEGVFGAKEEEDWISMWFSGVDNYAPMTANALNADYRILSQSGWGVLSSWDNNPNFNIPQYYEKICGVLNGSRNIELGAFENNDFRAWQADVIVVNLGTNDGGAFYSPGWQDSESALSFKQRLNEDGSFNEDDLKVFELAVENFLKKLRYYNNKAQIVWAYGMLGIPMLPAIYRAVDMYKKCSGDNKVSVFQLPDTTEDTVGSRSHPGIGSHKKAAKELSRYLLNFLNISKSHT